MLYYTLRNVMRLYFQKLATNGFIAPHRAANAVTPEFGERSDSATRNHSV